MADTINLDDKRPPRDERAPKSDTPRAGDATSGRAGAGNEGASAGGSRRTSASSARPRRSADARIHESLTGLYGTVGVAVTGIGQVQQNAGLVAAGVNITTQGESLAQAWLDLGNEVPAVRRALESMLKGGALTVVIVSHMTIVAPILAATGTIPQQVGNMFLSAEAIDAGMQFQAAAAQAAQAAQGNGGGTS